MYRGRMSSSSDGRHVLAPHNFALSLIAREAVHGEPARWQPCEVTPRQRITILKLRKFYVFISVSESWGPLGRKR